MRNHAQGEFDVARYRCARRIIVAVSEEGARRLSAPAWSRFGFVFCQTISAVVSQLGVAPGPVLIFDPVVSGAARDAVIAAVLDSGADVIVHTHRDKSTGERLVALMKYVVPIDTFFIGEDDLPDRLARLLHNPDVRSVEALTLARLAPAISKMPIRERSIVVDPFLTTPMFESVAELLGERGLVRRTVERHLRKSCLSGPEQILRGAGVARARRMLLEASSTLDAVASQCGMPSGSALSDSIKWATGMGLYHAIRVLDAEAYAECIASVLETP